METKIVKTRDTEVTITELARKEGLKIVLIDDKSAPAAWYEFDSTALTNRSKIEFRANGVKIIFDKIEPSMKCESCSPDGVQQT